MNIPFGTVVEVTDTTSRYRGCILTLIGREAASFLCRNDTAPMLYTADHEGRIVGAVRVHRIKPYRPEKRP